MGKIPEQVKCPECGKDCDKAIVDIWDMCLKCDALRLDVEFVMIEEDKD